MNIRMQTLDGADTKMRSIDDKHFSDRSDLHNALCLAFALDPCRTRIDAPNTRTPTRRWEALVLFSGEPIARMFEFRESDKFRDIDPTNRDDAWGRQTK